MSTPQTLNATRTVPPHHLDHRSLRIEDRYLPPPNPRPSSNLSNGYQNNIPARPSSNLSYRELQPPHRPESGAGYTHRAAGAGSEYAAANGRSPQQQFEDLRRTNSRTSQTHHRQLPPLPHQQHVSSTSRAPAATVGGAAEMPSHQQYEAQHGDAQDRNSKRRHKDPVDWVAFFGGKPPAEIIEIHDDDSPAPSATIQRPPPPTTNGSNTSQHVDKKRRVNGGSGEVATYSTTNTPYSNGASTESLQATTASTSLGSQASSGSRVETAQTGQKRKRTTRTSEVDRKKQEVERPGPKGYLAEYGEYVPPAKQAKKQKDVIVNAIHDRHKPTEKVDDEDGHYIVHENTRLGDKYTLISLLGQGTFGKVVRAIDMRSRREVAVKIIRAVPKYRDASRIELRVLQTLRAADEHNRNRCIQLRDCFDWRGHICIVTPLLGLSVFDFLKSGGFVPFPGSHIQAFARQLLGSIAFLHDLNLIHTDLKPENILLLNHTYQTFTYNRNIPSSSTLTSRQAKFRRVLLSPHINLIDFGSATFDDEYHSSVVSTRHYRAPEIILGIGWSHPIDLWSLGCILVECWTGDALFQTHDCCEHLGMMEAVTGNPIDRSLIREVQRLSKRGDRNSAARFFKNGHLNYPMPDTPRQSRKFVRGMKRLEDIIPQTTNFNRLFLDLLRKIFVYDPKKRITAREALKHPWFDELVEDDGTEATRIRIERERLAEQGDRRR
ncbi:hypothetical protein M409DRAFT_58597 [Zasmidium cellare ATCC 36951]|uniref:Protein kinase domain-containing protein n=1 Tax=Zasmidium cellare ATCC 36951 TaxID=1080233 RepID=A0A6A6C7I0_ZASCE|nr:uncharacterized protein M409DRAFT_58597 [Zasmidium cellare ATCC 36951]KAF2162160.1 hypothetical protein M409DRAFT_58597 [Zasmidium cellare ATCC 36951]